MGGEPDFLEIFLLSRRGSEVWQLYGGPAILARDSIKPLGIFSHEATQLVSRQITISHQGLEQG